MKVKEALDKINNGCFYSLYTAELEILSDGAKEIASDMNVDKHMWFIVSTSVYKLEDGFIGVTGVSSVKSEGMECYDCDTLTKAEEYEEFATISYRPKLKNTNKIENEDFKDRLRIEYYELKDRLIKLQVALNKDGFREKVGDYQYKLMTEQELGMEKYFNALVARLKNVGIIIPECPVMGDGK